MAETSSRTDPYRAYNFKLEIQGVTEGHFTECSEMKIEVPPVYYREGGTAQVVRCLPGHVEYAHVTLRYGLTNSMDLWNWLMSLVQGKVERRNVSIVMMNDEGTTPVLQWNLIDAWPSQWCGPGLNALGQEAAIESLTLVFETLERG